QPDLAPRVRKLVRQLDAADLKTRQEAEDALVKLGPNALPLIKPYIANPETTEAARQTLKNVERVLQLAGAKAEAEAKTVTLSKDSMPLSEVLAALTEQTGNKIVDLRPAQGQVIEDPKLKVNFNKTPFWQALDRVLDDAKLK